MGRDHYRQFSHPVLVDLPSPPTTDLFIEMDEIADELRCDPRYVEGHLEIAFRQLQKRRRPGLSKAEFHDLFEIWRLHDRTQEGIREAAKRSYVAELCERREALFAERAVAPPQHYAVLTEKIFKIGLELAELNTPNLPVAPLGEWG
jgi:hypothetical protein